MTESQLVLLKELQRNTSNRSTYQKLTTLLMLHKQYPTWEIADTLGIDASTVNRDYHQYTQSRDLEQYLQSHYKPYQGKLSEQQLQGVQSYVEQHLCASSLVVKAYISQSYGITYTANGVIALLHRLGFSYKKTKLVPSKADASKQEHFVEAFCEREETLPADEVILFGDGCHRCGEPSPAQHPSQLWVDSQRKRTADFVQ